jgi:hypothetical protein
MGQQCIGDSIHFDYGEEEIAMGRDSRCFE